PKTSTSISLIWAEVNAPETTPQKPAADIELSESSKVHSDGSLSPSAQCFTSTLLLLIRTLAQYQVPIAARKDAELSVLRAPERRLVGRRCPPPLRTTPAA